MSLLFCYLADFVREFKRLLKIYWDLLIKCFLLVNNQNVGLINQAPTINQAPAVNQAPTINQAPAVNQAFTINQAPTLPLRIKNFWGFKSISMKLSASSISL